MIGYSGGSHIKIRAYLARRKLSTLKQEKYLPAHRVCNSPASIFKAQLDHLLIGI